MDITSANSTFVISASSLAIASVALEGYSVDTAWDLEDSEVAVTQIGVDGKMSAGYVPRLYPVTFTFAPDSASISVFETIVTTQDVLKSPVEVNGVLQIPSINKSYTFMRGVVTRGKMLPGGGRVLGQQAFTITFNSCKPAIL